MRNSSARYRIYQRCIYSLASKNGITLELAREIYRADYERKLYLFKKHYGFSARIKRAWRALRGDMCCDICKDHPQSDLFGKYSDDPKFRCGE